MLEMHNSLPETTVDYICGNGAIIKQDFKID